MNDNPKPGKNGFKFPEHSIKTKITDVKPNELVTRGYNGKIAWWEGIQDF